jgi:PhnB protein
MDQLNDAVERMIASPDAATPSLDALLMPILHTAINLRNFPSNEFKMRLKARLLRRTEMMPTKVNPIPEGHVGPVPYLSVKNAASAIKFYKNAFGAKEVMRLLQPDGRIGHAELKIGDALIMIADEFPEYGVFGPETLGGSPVSLHLYVQDVDAFTSQAIVAGARMLQHPVDEFYGDRAARFADPFGHIWKIATHKEDVTAEEMQNRLEALMKQESPDKPKEIRGGLRTVTPYLICHEAAELIDFVKAAFEAEEHFRTIGSAGGIHAEVQIGDSMVMIGGGAAWKGTPSPASIHLYVNDADAVYERALQAGATSLQKPVDQDYGDREAGVQDMAGNQWFIATHRETGNMPAGFHSITPFFHPKGAANLVDFLKRAFDAQELSLYKTPDGTIAHAVIGIGNSRIEMGEAHGQWQPMPSTILLDVNDVDEVYRKAISAGGTSAGEPADQTYGSRTAGVQDPHGNTWYISGPLKKPVSSTPNES